MLEVLGTYIQLKPDRPEVLLPRPSHHASMIWGIVILTPAALSVHWNVPSLHISAVTPTCHYYPLVPVTHTSAHFG